MRLAVRVESAVAFLLQLARGEHPSLVLNQAPGLHISAGARRELEMRFAESQRLMKLEVRPMLLGWLAELEGEELEARVAKPDKVDELCREMSKVRPGPPS